ncbi:hypothetical protein HY386_00350 [Candidatus Daviesbacteria bacterium]|nr:hypothetical protein [Candidatus Daviesbacteria bacterium]
MDNQPPATYQAPQNQNSPSERRGLLRYLTPKTIFIILGVVIFGELIWGIRIFLSPVPKTSKQVLQPLSAAKIVLIADKQNIKVGDIVSVRVRVITGGRPTTGTDLVLRYDPKILEAASDGSIVKGTIYDEYPLINVDNEAGVIRISGVESATGTDSFNGVADFATINFRAQTIGKSELVVDMIPGLTNESNVVESGSNADILQSVTNTTINVQ